MNAAEMLHSDLLTLNKLVEKKMLSKDIVEAITRRATEKGISQKEGASSEIKLEVTHDEIKNVLNQENV